MRAVSLIFLLAVFIAVSGQGSFGPPGTNGGGWGAGNNGGGWGGNGGGNGGWGGNNAGGWGGNRGGGWAQWEFDVVESVISQVETTTAEAGAEIREEEDGEDAAETMIIIITITTVTATATAIAAKSIAREEEDPLEGSSHRFGLASSAQFSDNSLEFHTLYTPISHERGVSVHRMIMHICLPMQCWASKIRYQSVHPMIMNLSFDECCTRAELRKRISKPRE
ncbi:hypothetical protein PRIPAC_88048 [Pristionchus pacificus]|uniref:Uncharacterized protein n=1 Tax=Pristionchus pacificus TaxID=54126 RepID=A0A2A6CVI9_PRIPA|nr:hypothetical protein PRIPAC_88048 [Pristionchus pacificus]|eukprot:PDM82179.1 hypothetical protein PRIPAC_36572 [Pristionchus pacificus]